MSNSSSPSPSVDGSDTDVNWVFEMAVDPVLDDIPEANLEFHTPPSSHPHRPPPQPPLAVIRDDVHNRPHTRRRISGGFGKGKKRKNKVVNNKNKKNSNKNKKNRSGGSSTVKVSGSTYKVQKGPRGGKFIRRGGKKVYLSSKK